ncbi:SCO family protein [Polaromonas sp.]|uniref:SCO family protein n=1 Tax=Polaromonas sp. TaxID=1869339 RepID=UPI0025F97C65|nr:SCO family protein [Polaromonas sp.]
MTTLLLTLPTVPNRRQVVRHLAGAAALSVAAGLLAACSPEKPQFSSIDLTGADYPQGFSLLDQNGKPRALKDFAGKVVVVFFGFTQCPDVCPTTMADLAQVKQQLGPDGGKLQAIFITVDPERDTPELLKAYMGNFDPSFLALRPTLDQLPQVAKDFKVYYKKVDGKTPGSYTMDHSAGSYVFDGKGRVRLYTRYGVGAEVLASDIRLLLKTS